MWPPLWTTSAIEGNGPPSLVGLCVDTPSSDRNRLHRPHRLSRAPRRVLARHRLSRSQLDRWRGPLGRYAVRGHRQQPTATPAVGPLGREFLTAVFVRVVDRGAADPTPPRSRARVLHR